MKNVFPKYSSAKQSKEIRNLLKQFKFGELTDVLKRKYSIHDMLQILPDYIILNDRKGYLSISHIDISYGAIESNNKMNIVLNASLIPDKNIFDGFIEILKQFVKYKSNLTYSLAVVYSQI